MSVLPSRPLAVKTSGALKPAASQRRDVGFLELATSEPSLVAAQLRDVGQIDARVGVDVEAHVGREAARRGWRRPSVSGVRPEPSKLMR